MISPVGTLNASQAPVLRKTIITNSVVTTVNDSVKISSGFGALGTTGALVFGHVVAHKSKLDVGLLTSGASGAEIGSYVGTFTAASDNQTVAKVTVECDVSKATLYSAENDATLGTTTGSNLLGYHIDLVDEDTLDESSAVTGTAQYHIWGVDPNDSTKSIVNVYESNVFGV